MEGFRGIFHFRYQPFDISGACSDTDTLQEVCDLVLRENMLFRGEDLGSNEGVSGEGKNGFMPGRPCLSSHQKSIWTLRI